MRMKLIRYLLLFQRSSLCYMSFILRKCKAVQTLPPAGSGIRVFVALVNPQDHRSSGFPPACSPISSTATTTHQHKAQIAAQLLGEGPVHLSGIEKFWSEFEDFLVHKALAGNVVSIKWDVNFHEYFPHGCSLWSLSNLAITMWSVGHTAWVKFKKLADSQWGEGQNSITCVFSLFLSFLFFSPAHFRGWLCFSMSLGATICLRSVYTSGIDVPSHFQTFYLACVCQTCILAIISVI